MPSPLRLLLGSLSFYILHLTLSPGLHAREVTAGDLSDLDLEQLAQIRITSVAEACGHAAPGRELHLSADAAGDATRRTGRYL